MMDAPTMHRADTLPKASSPKIFNFHATTINKWHSVIGASAANLLMEFRLNFTRELQLCLAGRVLNSSGVISIGFLKSTRTFVVVFHWQQQQQRAVQFSPES